MTEIYRKKPVEIEATRWTGENSDELVEWTRGDFTWVGDLGEIWDALHETWVRLSIGDYIIKGVKGEFYPIKADVLAQTYDKVDNA